MQHPGRCTARIYGSVILRTHNAINVLIIY